MSSHWHADPLSGINGQLELNKVYQLAIGPNGWFKVPHATQTLLYILNKCGRRLISIRSFNSHKYLTFRQRQKFHGLITQNGGLESIELPKADTGTVGEGGLLCLRALSSALLTVYSLRTAQEVMHEIFTDLLDAKQFSVDQAFKCVLNQFMSTVQDEEQSNTLGKTLWDHVDDQMTKTLALKNCAAAQRTRCVKEIPAIKYAGGDPTQVAIRHNFQIITCDHHI
jgi:hypothetical protein